MVRYRVDVASVTLSAPRPDLVCHRLVAQEVLVLVPAGHPWAGRQAVDVAELDGQDFILREPGSMTRQVFERALADSAVEIRKNLVLSSREAVKEAVANGLGLGIVFNRELGQDPRIAGLGISGAEVRADEYLVAHPEIAHLGSVREFIACSAAMTSLERPTQR